MTLSFTATALVFLFFLAAALADLHQRRGRGSPAHIRR